jgi:hypothetical protein
MGCKNVYHCPAPDRTCLTELLRALLGRRLCVTVPGGTVEGKLTAVGRTGFYVGGRMIDYQTSFYFPLPSQTGPLRAYKATAAIEELEAISGRLSRIGKDYTVIKSEKKVLQGRFVVVPLNIFSQLTCEKDHAE